MDIQIEPKEALTGFLNLPGVGQIRLDFLITYESDAFYIRCLDFGVMSWGKTVEECKEDIKDAIGIYLEDLKISVCLSFFREINHLHLSGLCILSYRKLSEF